MDKVRSPRRFAEILSTDRVGSVVRYPEGGRRAHKLLQAALDAYRNVATSHLYQGDLS
jgi:hypothetical protein